MSGRFFRVMALMFGLAMSSLASAGLTVNLNLSDDDVGGYYDGLGSYYGYDRGYVDRVHRHYRLPYEELPVAFYYADLLDLDPIVVVRLRSSGLSWWDIGVRYRLPVSAYYYDVPRHYRSWGPVAPFYRYPRHRWDRIHLGDRDIIDLINLRYTCHYYGGRPDRYIDLRRGGRHYIHVDRDFYRQHGWGRQRFDPRPVWGQGPGSRNWHQRERRWDQLAPRRDWRRSDERERHGREHPRRELRPEQVNRPEQENRRDWRERREQVQHLDRQRRGPVERDGARDGWRETERAERHNRDGWRATERAERHNRDGWREMERAERHNRDGWRAQERAERYNRAVNREAAPEPITGRSWRQTVREPRPAPAAEQIRHQTVQRPERVFIEPREARGAFGHAERPERAERPHGRNGERGRELIP